MTTAAVFDEAWRTPSLPAARQWLRQLRLEVWSIGVFSAVANLLMLVPTLYMLMVYDRVLTSQSGWSLVFISLICLFLLGLMGCAEWFRSRVLVRIGFKFHDMLAPSVLNAAFKAHLHKPGMQPARPFSDLTEIRQFLTGNGMFVLFDAPWAVIFIGVLFMLHPVLGWTALAFALVQVAVVLWGNHGSALPAEELTARQQASLAHVQSKLRAAEAIESMGFLPDLWQKWLRLQNAYADQHGKTFARQHRVMAISKFLRYVQQSASLGVGALLVINGELSAGAMIAANILMGRSLAPIDLVVGSWKSILSARSAYGRLASLLAEHGIDSPPGVVTVGDGQSGLTMVDVSARAPGATPTDKPLIQHVNLSLKPGQITVVMGPSGSGKSTLVRVALGVWSASAGQVLWQGGAIDGWSEMQRAQQIGYLPQELEFMDATIAQNIARLGKVEPEAVIEAAKLAGLHDMILRLPAGYDTRMGPGGVVLSGGQRQRLGLARALYGNPQWVVLDEPNANLDEVGERALAQALTALRTAGATVLLISHRPGVLSLADQVAVMGGGQVLRVGPASEVLAALQTARVAAEQKQGV
jgi:ATP-binding cassette subfamily C exporter for protease/lipase